MPELLSRDERDAIEGQMRSGVPVFDQNYELAIAQAVLGAGVLRIGDFRFEDGPSNNRLEMERLFDPANVEPRAAVLSGLGRLATRFKPDGVYGIPPNGELFASALGEILDVPVIGLQRTRLGNGRRTYNLASINGEECPANHFDGFKRLVAIKDVSDSYGSVHDCLRSSFLSRQTAAAIVLWARGENPPFDSSVWDLGVSLQALIHWPIERQLNESHDLYRFARPAV